MPEVAHQPLSWLSQPEPASRADRPAHRHPHWLAAAQRGGARKDWQLTVQVCKGPKLADLPRTLAVNAAKRAGYVDLNGRLTRRAGGQDASGGEAMAGGTASRPPHVSVTFFSAAARSIQGYYTLAPTEVYNARVVMQM